MTKWEYNTILVTGKANNLEAVDEILDDVGTRGWELTAVIPLHVSWSSVGSSGMSFLAFLKRETK